jgi:Tetracyclin repressor-like, C-terminal domain
MPPLPAIETRSAGQGAQPLIAGVDVALGGRDQHVSAGAGSLRGDVIGLLKLANRVRLAMLVFTQLGGFYREANTNLAELAAFIQGGRDAMLDEVIERAVARGEIRAGQVSDRVARVPVDLFRYELMMTLKPIADEVIEDIVDTVFLPLVRLGAAETS